MDLDTVLATLCARGVKHAKFRPDGSLEEVEFGPMPETTAAEAKKDEPPDLDEGAPDLTRDPADAIRRANQPKTAS